MLFDADMFSANQRLVELILKRKLTCQIEMYFAWLTFFVLPQLYWDKVLLFSNFQRSFWLYQPPVFLTECKGKGLFISTKFFAAYFSIKNESFRMKINLFCEELSLFFSKRTAKVRDWKLPTNFWLFFCSHLPNSLFTNFRELVRFIWTGGKDMFDIVSTKYFLGKKTNN